jgi:hypothetical protein
MCAFVVHLMCLRYGNSPLSPDPKRHFERGTSLTITGTLVQYPDFSATLKMTPAALVLETDIES